MKNKNWKKAYRGVTLIELIIAIAIVGIMVAISWAILGGTKDTSNVKNACEEAAGAINQAKNYALTGKCSGDGASKVTVSFDDDGGTIKDDKSNCDEAFTLPKGTTCDSESINFSIPDGVLSGVASVTCASGGATRTVKVDSLKAYCE